MTVKSLAIVGHGKMGRAIEHLAPSDGWSIAGVLDEGWQQGQEAGHAVLTRASVAVEFTEPRAVLANIRAIVAAGCPLVVGTTGWYDSLGEVVELVKKSGAALLWSPNFSPGAQIMLSIAGQAAALAKRAENFDAHLLETHHSAKKDVPSGTAVSIARAAAEAMQRQIMTTSVRTGHDPGTHELIFDAPFEQIRITHRVRDRRVFAAGALLAADWLRARVKEGARGVVFTMQDVLQSTGNAGGEDR